MCDTIQMDVLLKYLLNEARKTNTLLEQVLNELKLLRKKTGQG